MDKPTMIIDEDQKGESGFTGLTGIDRKENRLVSMPEHDVTLR